MFKNQFTTGIEHMLRISLATQKGRVGGGGGANGTCIISLGTVNNDDMGVGGGGIWNMY